MRKWLSACLEPSMFSMPFLDDGHKKALFAQVLAVNPIVKTVEMFKEAGNEDNPESFKIAVQAYDTWAPVNFDPGRTRRPCRGVYHVRANRCGFHQGFGRSAR